MNKIEEKVEETMEEKLLGRKITLELLGLDGNAFYLIGAFTKQARREGWTKEETDFVVKDCMSGNYDHLLQTLLTYCESPKDNEDDYDDEDDE